MTPFELNTTERFLMTVGRILGTRVTLTLAGATIASILVSSLVVFLVRGEVTITTPFIAALCCLGTATPIHLALKGYHNLIKKQRDSMKQQALQMRQLNEQLEAINVDLKAFSYRVAHDLRTPLTVIETNAHVLIDPDSVLPDDERLDCLKDIADASDNAAQIINSILFLSHARISPPEMGPCNLYDILERAIASLQSKLKARDLHVEVVHNDVPYAHGHAPWLERIWVNLIDNAIKYGGPSPNIQAGVRVQGRKLHAWVSDDGPGVPAQVRERLFSDFQTTSQHDMSGFGLGLAMVKQLTHHMNGEISLKDTEAGAHFCFTIPLTS